MAYVADTFVAGEQPTTSKWNELWGNDASFNDGTGIGAGAIGTGALATGSVTQVKLAAHPKVGTFSNPSSTGNVSVTGVGFKPALVRFTALFSSSSTIAHFTTGVMDSSGNQSSASTSYSNTANSGFANSSSTHCIALNTHNSAALAISATYVSMDSDGFTIGFDAASTAEGISAWAYEAWY